MSKFNGLARDIARAIRNPLSGLVLLIIGVFAMVYPRTMPNPIPEAIELWHAIGSSFVFAGITVGFQDFTQIFTRNEERERHKEVLNEVKNLRQELEKRNATH